MHKSAIIFLALWFVVAAGCDTSQDNGGTSSPAAGAESAAAKPTVQPAAEAESATAKMGGPITMSYRLIGVPVVGQPLAIDLEIASALGDQPVRIDYRILDPTALRLAESQSPYATVARTAPDAVGTEQVSVVPLREGRLYLNVAASIETEQGSMSTVTAIPIQVGSAVREAQENGRLSTEPDGESVRVLSGSEE